MVKYFLASAAEDGELAERIIDELSEYGLENTADEYSDETEALKAADCLLVLVTSPNRTALPEIRRRWEFFDGEIRWKRKARGEILLLASSDDSLGGLPLRLKKCGYYYTEEIADVAEYLEETYGSEKTETENAQVEASESEQKYELHEIKEIKYTPSQEIIESPKYTVKAPSVDPFDGKPIVRSSDKPSGACKENHVFEDDFGASRGFGEQNKKTNTAGCFIIAIMVIIIMAVFASVIMGIASSCEDFIRAASITSELSGEFDTAVALGGFANALQTFPLVL